MQSSSYIKLCIIFLLLTTFWVEGQRRRPSNRNRGRGRNRNRNRGQPENNEIYCYTCYADFENIPSSVFNPVTYIYKNLCYNPATNYSMTDNEYLTKCSPSTKFCSVDITRMNNVLLSVDRRCGTATCRETCVARGYGVLRETCTFCCGGRVNEDSPEYDEEEHANYKCPGKPHWLEPQWSSNTDHQTNSLFLFIITMLALEFNQLFLDVLFRF